MKYEVWYGPDLIGRARSVWGIRRTAHKWLRMRENTTLRRPAFGNLRFTQRTDSGAVIPMNFPHS